MTRFGLALGAALVLYAVIAHDLATDEALQFWRDNAVSCWAR